MNRSEKIREHLAANPGQRPGQIAKQTGLPIKLVCNAVRQMTKRGILTHDELGYHPGRMVMIDRTERARMAHKAMAAARRSAKQQPKVRPHGLTDCARRIVVTTSIPAPDTEAFIRANPERYEVYPAFQYVAPVLMPFGGKVYG